MPNRPDSLDHVSRWCSASSAVTSAYAYFPDSERGFRRTPPALLPTVFLRLIKMIIAPLVFAHPGGGHRQDGRHRDGRARRRQSAGVVHRRLR